MPSDLDIMITDIIAFSLLGGNDFLVGRIRILRNSLLRLHSRKNTRDTRLNIQYRLGTSLVEVVRIQIEHFDTQQTTY